MLLNKKREEISIRDVKYLILIQKWRSLSRAADHLSVTQTALTHAVRRVERQLGLKLFVRTPDGLRTTPESDKFLSQAVTIIAQWERLPDVLRPTELLEGTYSIGCHSTIGVHLISKVIPSLLSENPDLSIEIKCEISRIVQSMVGTRSIDFGVVVNPISTQNQIIRRLGYDRFGLWHHVSLSHKQIESADLYFDNSLMQCHWLKDKYQKKGIQFGRIVSIDSLEVSATLAEESNGCCFLPHRFGQRFKNLVPYEGVHSSILYDDEFSLIYQEQLVLSPAAKKLARSLEKKLKNEFLS